MSKVFTDVHVFMSAAGQETLNRPIKLETPQAQLYKKLIKEEYKEFINADKAEDDTERLDACFDMIWVIIGYMISRGWNCEMAWDEGAKSNLSKIDIQTGKVKKREDGKILKPDGWQPPDFTKYVK